MRTALLVLIVLGAVSHLLLGGAGVIRLVVQLPARASA